MIGARIKQVVLGVLLVASLLVGSASACACPHHREQAVPAETACHGAHHEAAEKAEPARGALAGHAVDLSCTCFVNFRVPSAIAKTPGKKLKAPDTPSGAGKADREPGIVTVSAFHLLPDAVPAIFYSGVLKFLLPSRAPPRL